ncbi:hypothetical protein, partial [Kroppenstedtia guangzhouensis]|uniref:hypothetical protein n=1 Tax=Kroppenstedtia guangzhouensis TaxID=1274356 RepID=UPI001E2F3C11
GAPVRLLLPSRPLPRSVRECPRRSATTGGARVMGGEIGGPALPPRASPVRSGADQAPGGSREVNRTPGKNSPSPALRASS